MSFPPTVPNDNPNIVLFEGNLFYDDPQSEEPVSRKPNMRDIPSVYLRKIMAWATIVIADPNRRSLGRYVVHTIPCADFYRPIPISPQHFVLDLDSQQWNQCITDCRGYGMKSLFKRLADYEKEYFERSSGTNLDAKPQ